MLNLTVNHHIFLNRDQRYALHAGQSIEVTGISVPVWFVRKKTNEPAKEVFCRYYIYNMDEHEVPIQIVKDGYKIYMPHREGTKITLSDKEWWDLKRKEPDKMEAYYDQIVAEVSSKNLLDIKDGGSGCMFYREHNKFKKNDEYVNITHYVCIETIEDLMGSLVSCSN
jgi:hypothetical protein